MVDWGPGERRGESWWGQWSRAFGEVGESWECWLSPRGLSQMWPDAAGPPQSRVSPSPVAPSPWTWALFPSCHHGPAPLCTCVAPEQSVCTGMASCRHEPQGWISANRNTEVNPFLKYFSSSLLSRSKFIDEETAWTWSGPRGKSVTLPVPWDVLPRPRPLETALIC